LKLNGDADRIESRGRYQFLTCDGLGRDYAPLALRKSHPSDWDLKNIVSPLTIIKGDRSDPHSEAVQTLHPNLCQSYILCHGNPALGGFSLIIFA